LKHYRPFCFTSDSNNKAGFKYRAFLSYSHRDSGWAKWLHRSLEEYWIDKDLVGRETATGAVPETLRPIFRDRDDFSAGHSLTEQTLAALEASQFLIVICSPDAAQSPYVNEEVRRFKQLDRTARVIPLIVEGQPGDPQLECFPPAVRFKLGADGALTGEREEPIAADARPQGDGKEIAKQKIVAGLLGVGLDEIMRRAKRARTRRNRIRLIAASIAALVAVGAFVGWRGAFVFASRLDSFEILGAESDLADVCEHASSQAVLDQVREERRIAFAAKCVDELSNGLDDIGQRAHVPRTFIVAFEKNVAILRSFSDAGKLSSHQSEVLAKGEQLAAALSRR
jgi:TIR domain